MDPILEMLASLLGKKALWTIAAVAVIVAVFLLWRSGALGR